MFFCCTRYGVTTDDVLQLNATIVFFRHCCSRVSCEVLHTTTVLFELLWTLMYSRRFILPRFWGWYCEIVYWLYLSTLIYAVHICRIFRNKYNICTCTTLCGTGVWVGAVRSRLRTVHWSRIATVRSAVSPAAELRASHRPRQDPGRPRKHWNHHPATQLPWLLRRMRWKRLLLVAGQSVRFHCHSERRIDLYS